ncbi:RNA polymerase factor sigma-54 [Filimonas effusa]|uniref:RNA polymerase sigma-54 factor n=1 Tax=Filimonas effusa TaxID=2508721 RepID=A0A4Q1DAC6_9BACT|nr:RNA polymerase factor sigma-54 [Filimonas effusa]RXK86354.1 RNA polymerase sigma-54 factor [Filimonas effusa]
MIHQQLGQKGQLKVLPQKIQFLNFLYLNRQELEMRIQNELIENPLLDLAPATDTGPESSEAVADFKGLEEYMYDDIPDYKAEYQNYLPDNAAVDKPVEDTVDFREDLKKQLRLVEADADIHEAGDYVIDSLNEHGMLDADAEALAEEYSFQVERFIDTATMQKAIDIVKTLEPPGVGAASVRESLLLQLQRTRKDPVCRKACTLLESYYDLLTAGSFDKVRTQMGLDEEEFQIVMQYITRFNPHPMVTTDQLQEKKQFIIPDLFLTSEDDRLVVSLNNPYSGRLSVGDYKLANVNSTPKEQKQAKQYISNKTTAASWFIGAVQQREATMLKIMEAIVAFQEAYFRTGDTDQLRPMILKQVADKAGVDISTVSRATANKYVETEFGMVSLKRLFSEGVHNTAGEVVSNRIIRDKIAAIIDGENKQQPHTDQQLADILRQNGIVIARRTVTKYREQLQLPVAQLRKLSASIQPK